MNFVDLKKSFMDKVYPVYVLAGNDAFLIDYAYGLIRNKVNVQFEELNLNIFQDETIGAKELTAVANTMPFMSDKKLIYVHSTVTDIPVLKDYANSPNESSVLVINAGNDKKTYLGIGETVDCDKLGDKLVSGFALTELKKYNKQITKSALDTLLSYCLFDLSLVVNNIQKLVSLVDESGVISQELVEANVNKTMEYQIFELTESLGRKNSKRTFEVLNQIKLKKDGVKTLVGLVYSHFRRLFYVAISENNKTELSNFLRLKEYAVVKAMEQSRLFTKKQLKNIVDMCSEYDFLIKQSNMTSEMAIDGIVLNILNMK